MNITEEDKVQEALGLKFKYRIWLEAHEKDLDAPYRISKNIELIALHHTDAWNKVEDEMLKRVKSLIKLKKIHIDEIYCVLQRCNSKNNPIGSFHIREFEEQWLCE